MSPIHSLNVLDLKEREVVTKQRLQNTKGMFGTLNDDYIKNSNVYYREQKIL